MQSASVLRWVRAFILLLLTPVLLAACGPEPVWAPDEAVARAHYQHPGPPTLTLFTVNRNESGSGVHAGLMINASERVLFDPAGTWFHRLAPERNDVHFGFTPRMYDIYLDYHARETHHVVIQRLEVSPEVAESVLHAVKAYGAVPKTQCARSITEILSQIPGFESISVTWYPGRLAQDFGQIPGVRTETVFSDAAADNRPRLAAAQ